MLRFGTLTDSEIQMRSFGLVSNPIFEEPADWRDAKASLYDQGIFGPKRNFHCACGRIKGIKHDEMICWKCGTKIGQTQRLRRTRFGHVALCQAVPHPLAPETPIQTVAALPIFYRSPKRLGGADLNFLYAELLRANQAQQAPAELIQEKLGQLYCNEWQAKPLLWKGRPVRSLLHYLLNPPPLLPSATGIYLTALGLKLTASETPNR